MRRHMSKRVRVDSQKDLEKYKRQKRGAEPVGYRTWQWPFEQFFGKRWWDTFNASKWAEFAEATVGSSLFALFQSQLKGILKETGNQHMEEDKERYLEKERREKDEEVPFTKQ